jgi:hypothetical protein
MLSIKDKLSDKKSMYDLVGDYCKKIKNNIVLPVYKPSNINQVSSIQNVTANLNSYVWDQAKTGGGIQIT